MLLIVVFLVLRQIAVHSFKILIQFVSIITGALINVAAFAINSVATQMTPALALLRIILRHVAA